MAKPAHDDIDDNIGNRIDGPGGRAHYNPGVAYGAPQVNRHGGGYGGGQFGGGNQGGNHGNSHGGNQGGNQSGNQGGPGRNNRRRRGGGAGGGGGFGGGGGGRQMRHPPLPADPNHGLSAAADAFLKGVSIDPTERFVLEMPGDPSTRAIDLIAPIGRGQRALLVAPPKAGKTVLLQKIAHALAHNHPEVKVIILLIDERPEEVTDMRRTVTSAEVHAASSDEHTQKHVRIAQQIREHALDMAGRGEDVVVLLDSITRLARAHNTEQRGPSKILSGGLDARTMEVPRKFFGSARKVENGGSLTLIATALVDTGSRLDEVIFEEFKGTGNMELVLSRAAFEKRMFPSIDIAKSGTRKEEKLWGRETTDKLHKLRRHLADLPTVEALDKLLELMKRYKTNVELLAAIK